MCETCNDNGPLQLPVTNCVDCQPVQPPCVNGEPCDEVTDAGCVEYTNEALTAINVLPGDRLNDILRKLNINRSTQAVNVDNSFSVHLTGSGLSSDKLKADVQFNPAADNVTRLTDTGLYTKIDKAVIMTILNQIHDDADLSAVFCAIVAQCVDLTCSIASNVSSQMS